MKLKKKEPDIKNSQLVYGTYGNNTDQVSWKDVPQSGNALVRKLSGL